MANGYFSIFDSLVRNPEEGGILKTTLKETQFRELPVDQKKKKKKNSSTQEDGAQTWKLKLPTV